MATNPTLLVQPIAANGAKNVIPNTTTATGAMSQDQGFPAETALPLGAGGVPPAREDFNGAFNLLSAQNFMTQKGWVYTFDAGQAYYAGCIIRDTTDGKMYECINDVAAGGSVPSDDAVNWKEFGVDPSTFANTDLSNLTVTGEARFAHVVVDSYYDIITGDWWREYADGWVEQGGYVTTGQSYATITFLKPFNDTLYTLTINKISIANVAIGSGDTFPQNKTTTTFTFSALNASYYSSGSWFACGMSAQ